MDFGGTSAHPLRRQRTGVIIDIGGTPMNASILRLTALPGICALAFSAAAPVHTSQLTLPLNQQRAIEADARKELRAFGAAQPVPGVFIAVYVPGYAPYVKSVGYANLPLKAPFHLSDKFRIGSNTKTFVVTVLLQLADEHRLSLDDPVSKFGLGVKIPNARKITVRQLCEMRSGLFETYNTPQFNKMDVTPQTRVTPVQMVRWAAAHKPLFAPGAKYNYSNTNYIILGMIIEKITHDSVGNQIRKRLLEPMGLNATSFPETAAMPSPFSHGYDARGKGAWHDVTVDIPPSVTWAAGAMVSTVPDMKRWVKSYVLGTRNSKAMQRERLRCIPTGLGKDLSFGLGIGCSAGWYGYTGGLPGYNTAAYYLPSKDITVIAFVNAQREKPVPGVANNILRDITRIITPGNVAFKYAALRPISP
jgi:D-alanyl-D-alanine carboxypeptidase